MPTIKAFDTCRIAIYPREHGIPHFHVEFADGGRVGVAIETLEILNGSVRPSNRLAEPLSWAARHQELLREKWREISS